MAATARRLNGLAPQLLLVAWLLLTVVPLFAAAASVVGFDAAFTSAAAPYAVTECDAACTSPGSISFQLKLTRTGSLSATGTVYVSTRPPSDAIEPAAAADADYTAMSNVEVVFAPSETLKTVTVTVLSDGVYEEDEHFEVVIQSPSTGVSLEASAQVAYITIRDGGDAGIFSFSASTYSFLENAGTVQVKVVRAGGASGAVTVSYRLANQAQATAINTKSFFLTDVVYQLTFEPNQREAFIPIRILNDDVYESQEFFFLELSGLVPMKANDPTSSIASLGATRATAITIADDGDAGQFGFAASSIFCREDNGSAVVTIVRWLGSSSSSYTPVTLTVTTVGTSDSNATEGGSLAFDYLETSGKLTWANGETRKIFVVKVFNNRKYDPLARAFMIRMSAVEGGASIGAQSEIWVYLVDDRDAGTISFKQAQYEVLENAGSVTVEIARTGLTDSSGVNTYTSGVVTVDVATYGGVITPGRHKYAIDYDNGVVEARKCTHQSPCTAAADVAYMALASTTVTFADGENSKLVTISILDDSLFQAPDRVFRVVLQNATGGAHLGIDFEHPSEWTSELRPALLLLDRRRNELLDFVGTIVSIKDDGDAAVVVSKASLSVSELGQTDRFDVWLNSAPTADVAVVLTADPTVLTLSAASLMFTATSWRTRQSVVVTAVANNKSQGLPHSAITVAATSSDPSYNAALRTSLAAASGFVLATKIYTQSPGSYDSGSAQHAFPWDESAGVLTAPQPTVQIVVYALDDDPAGVVVVPEAVRHLSASTLIPENHVAVRMDGHNATMRVSLASEPARRVDLSLVAEADSGVQITPSSLIFTAADWFTPQAVEIQAVALPVVGSSDGVKYSSVRIVTKSSADGFYNRPPNDPIARVFVARFPPAAVQLDASTLETRENDASAASYALQLGSEPMHWQPRGSGQYSPFELVLPASADTTLSFSADAAIASAAAGAAQTFSAASNASTSTPTTRVVRTGVVRFAVHPTVASSTGSHQVGAAKLRLYRVSGGENGGLGGISVGVAVGSGDIVNSWDEASLRAECTSGSNGQISCGLRSGASRATTSLAGIFPATTSFLSPHDASVGIKPIDPPGAFNASANAYVPAPSWIELDVTLAVNAFLATQQRRLQSQQLASTDLTLLVYTARPAPPSFFVYDGVTEVTFASKDHKDATLRPQLRLLGSGRVNLARAATTTVSQSHAGNAKAAVDGHAASSLGVGASFAMSSTASTFPWWQADLGTQRLLEDVVVTIKRKVSSATLSATQLPVSIWLLLSDMPLATAANSGLAGFTSAKTTAAFARQFNVTSRSFSASEAETVVLRWRVFGAQGDAQFRDDHFFGNRSTTVEARYLLLQVEGDNSVVLNEVEIFQPALAGAVVAVGGFMPSPSVTRKGQNQISFQLYQPGDATSDECNSATAVCRHELLFSSGNWWQPQRVGVHVVNDAVATGDRTILLTHTLQSADPAFQGTGDCSNAEVPCAPGLFNDSGGVKPLRVLDDDDNAVLFSSSELMVHEGSGVYPNAPVISKERRVYPSSVRCSTDPGTTVTVGPTTVGRSSTCANVFRDDSALLAPWEPCISDANAEPLAVGSAWVIASFEEYSNMNATAVALTIPTMRGARYVQKLSLWWSSSLDLSSPVLLDLSAWTKIQSFDVAMTSTGAQTLHASGLALVSFTLLLVAFDKSYDDIARCLVAPAVVVHANVAVQFPLAVRGDLSSSDSVAPSQSGRSRMHQFGQVATLQVRLTSEPVEDVVVAVVAHADNAPLSVYAAVSNATLASNGVELVGGAYESGERWTFTAPTSLLFTPANWNLLQELTFLAVDDNAFYGNRSFSVSHVATSTDDSASVVPAQSISHNRITRAAGVLATEYSYANAPFIVAAERQAAWPRHWAPQWISGRGIVEVVVVDDDLPGVTLSTGVVVVSESAPMPANYSVSLDSAPAGDVVVTIQFQLDDSLLTVAPLRLTFSPTSWNIPQSVRLSPVANDVYDGGSPLTVVYDRLVAKTSQPLLKHKVSSATDTVYNGLSIGGNEADRSLAYVVSQGVVAIVLDDDTGCPHEYACLNAGVCGSVTYGGRLGSSSSVSVCRCPATYGMRNCAAECANAGDCAFSRVELQLQCRAGDASAVCGDVFSPGRLIATLYRMLTTQTLVSASGGTTYPPLSLAPLSEALYLANATAVSCAYVSDVAAASCVTVTIDILKATTGSLGDPVVDKLRGFFESGSLQSQPLFVELLTATPPHPHNLSATVAVWIFVGFCIACALVAAALFAARWAKVKRFHVQPQRNQEGGGGGGGGGDDDDARDDHDADVNMPLKGSPDVRAQ